LQLWHSAGRSLFPNLKGPMENVKVELLQRPDLLSFAIATRFATGP
jgi:hypothetical protein